MGIHPVPAMIASYRSHRLAKPATVTRMSAVMLACIAFYLVFCLFNTILLYADNVVLLILPVV